MDEIVTYPFCPIKASSLSGDSFSLRSVAKAPCKVQSNAPRIKVADLIGYYLGRL